MSSESITVEVPIEEALNGKTREEALETGHDEDSIEDFVEMTRDIERDRALRDLAKERVDKDDVPRAESLLWIDEAEVYSLCGRHYFEKRDGAWTGSTTYEKHAELRRQKEEDLREGRHCSECYYERVKAVQEELAGEVDVEVEIIE